MTLRRGGKRPRPPESIAAMLPEIYWHPPGPGEAQGQQHFPLGWYLEDLTKECRRITGNGGLGEVVEVSRIIGSDPATWYRTALASPGP